MKVSLTTLLSIPVGRSWDYKCFMVVAFFVAQASAMYTCYSVAYTEGLRTSGGIITDFDYTLNGLHIVISFCLGVCAIGLWSRRVWGLIISSLALISVFATFCYWRFITLKYVHELQDDFGLYRRVLRQKGFFEGATGWDFVVLSVIGSLALWHLVTWTRMALPKRAIAHLQPIGSVRSGYSGRLSSDASFMFALIAASLAALVHLVWFATSLLGKRTTLDAATIGLADWYPSVLMMHIRLGLALMISAGALLTRRVVGLILSALALVWICFEYLAWYFWSGHISFPAETSASNLYKVTPLNTVVFVLAFAVLLWVIKRLLEFRKSSLI